VQELLRVRGLTIEYRVDEPPIRAVEDFALDLSAGEILGVIGETGSGKSTAALALMALCRKPGQIVSGSVNYRGVNLLTASSSELRRIRGAEIGLVLQSPKSALNPLSRIGDQIANVCQAHRPINRREARAEAIAALEAVGISDPNRRARAYPHQLSGGMAQRVMIAMATINRPAIVIADEPTTGLDVTVQSQILRLLRERVTATASAAVLVSHDLGVIAHYCDRAIVMLDGKVVETAAVKPLFRTPQHEYTRRLIAAAPKLEWYHSDRGTIAAAPEPDSPPSQGSAP
jgi:ABC-type glutathione transport system ATPase component